MSGTRGGAWKRGTSQARPAPRNDTCTVPRPSSHQITTAKTMYEAIAVTANSPGEAGGGPKKIYVWIAIIKTPKPAGLMRPRTFTAVVRLIEMNMPTKRRSAIEYETGRRGNGPPVVVSWLQEVIESASKDV